ncbi:MAG: hypothetical protein LUF33_06235 [Clostridiales bacterium]|nr:hypothetical protein [Clostridiales bacterium]
MPSLEEEAFTRAQQMHRGVPGSSNESRSRQPRKEPPPQGRPKAEEAPPKVGVPATESAAGALNQSPGGDNLLGAIFENREQSLILLLIVLLMEEKAEPTLLIALMYLLL